ncbi:MAG: TlpA family protein disulfide reductase [Verrucomicrobia bacterium]|nr:TlpA family protein disulfide reductase [Verrucomicrobiota bacterium]
MKKINSLLVIALLASLSLTAGLTGCCDSCKTDPADPIEEPAVPAAKLGEKAKALTISEWVKGSAVDVTDGKNVYVVEFWATWCGPCRNTIPHLTELQKKYKDQGVVFVGVSSEKAEDVKPFVQEMGDKMDYNVAVDKDDATDKAYMAAYGQGGIPCAFIINKESQVVWVGHPMEMEKPLQEVIEGKYDLQAALKLEEVRASVDEYGLLASKKDPKAAELADKILQEVGTAKSIINDMLNAAYQAQDFPVLDKVLAKMASLDEDSAKRAKEIGGQIAAERAMGEYLDVATKNDEKATKEAETKLFATLKDNPDGLLMIASQFVDTDNMEMAEKTLDALAAVDEESAKKAARFRTSIKIGQLMDKYAELMEGESPKAEDKAAMEKELLELLKTEPKSMAQAAYSIVMRLGDTATLDFPVQLLDEADKIQTEKPTIPNDFFRAAIYIRLGDKDKGEEFGKKAIAAVEDEAMKKQLSSYLESLKPAKEEEE